MSKELTIPEFEPGFRELFLAKWSKYRSSGAAATDVLVNDFGWDFDDAVKKLGTKQMKEKFGHLDRYLNFFTNQAKSDRLEREATPVEWRVL